MTFSFFPPNAQMNEESNEESKAPTNAKPSPACAATPTAREATREAAREAAGWAAPLPLMALALGAALFLATPAQTPIAAGVTPNPGSGLGSGLETGLETGLALPVPAATAGRVAPGDSHMRLELTAAAEGGDAGAQYRLAIAHFLGTHPRASDRGALYWFGHAAGQGHVPAQLLLAQMYESGWGVASDRAQAIRWYRQAAASGDSLAAGKLRILGAGEA